VPREAEVECVTIDHADRGFVVPLSEVVRFHAERPEDAGPEDAGPDAVSEDSVDGALELLDLDRLLGAEPAATRAACVLVVRPEGGPPLGFRTRGDVQLGRAPERTLFRLPSVLREAGCSGWVHGVVAGDRAPGAGDVPRIWISLLHLARSLERGA